ncbi:MAG TPA: Hpt domain-containing protein [Pirellulales bacterium]|jgi:two-component system chemotaxis sensor kinase CheA|nr:Hpt domain-containing protein [Pirellulales bacterium]
MADIDEQVLGAFQVEHREHLEAIRKLIDCLSHNDSPGGDAELEEAFRRAHSLKGGARICALRPVETLSHRLETLFARMQQHGVRVDRDVVRAVNLALDLTEDWMAALASHKPPPEVDAALTAIDCVLERQPSAALPAAPNDEIADRLRAAFQIEHKQCVAVIRRVLAEVAQAPGEIGGDRASECFRMAHSLKGAARLCGLLDVARLGERLESLFARVRDQTLTLDQQACSLIASTLDAVKQAMAALATGGEAPLPAHVLEALEALLGLDSGRPSRPEPANELSVPQPPVLPLQLDVVRVTTASLDRLVRSAGQLHVESQRQNRVSQEIQQLCTQIDEMQRQRESLRKAAEVSLHHFGTRPELARVGRYLDSVDSQLRTLASHTRRVRLLQRRNCWQLSLLGDQLQKDVRQARMAPAESVFQGFRKMVRDLARDEAKHLEFSVTGLDAMADRMVLQTLKDPLMHMLRNAVTHGIEHPAERTKRGKSETGRIELRIETCGNRLRILVDDDGRGIDLARVAEVAAEQGLIARADTGRHAPDELARLIFQPGFSTSGLVTELSGRGIGLSVVSQAVARLQGDVHLCPKSTPGAAIQISVPVSIATHRLLFVACAGQSFAIPLHAIERLLRIKVADIETVERQPIVHFQRDLVPLIGLAQLLRIENPDEQLDGDELQVAILRAGNRRLAVGFASCVAERDCLVNELDGPAAAITRFAGGVFLEDGTVALVINPAELIGDFKSAPRMSPIKSAAQATELRRSTVLIVDDSFTTRTLEKTLLEAHGYDVRIAVDGIEALAQLDSERHGIDLVISDVQMPRLDGFGLLGEMKADKRLANLPVILVTSLDKTEDQERGLSLGADAYIVKRKFDHEDLLNTIRQII